MNDRQIDALQLLRRTREDGIDPSDDDLARGLARLEQEIAASGEPRTAPTGTPAPRRRRRRRAALLAGAGIIAAGAFAGVTLVLTPSPVLGPIAAPDPHAQAVAMLERAADEALGAGAELQAGQFLRVGIRSEGISSQWDARTMGRGAPVALVRSVTDTAWYYPADENGSQISRDSRPYGHEVVYPTGDSESERAVRDEVAAANATVAADPEAPEVSEHEWNPADMATRHEVPANPAELRESIAEQARVMLAERPGQTEEGLALELTMGYAAEPSQPRGVRAAALRLLSESPRVVAEGFAGYTAPAQVGAGESGLSIAAGMSVSIRMSLPGAGAGTIEVDERLIFDADTARLIGTRTTLAVPSDEYPGFPVGAVISATSRTASVVDWLPEVEDWE